MGISVEVDTRPAREKDRINSDIREEGEIVEDEFEDIISSDEEFSMRKRIEELEARNLELEKIANISGIYSCDLGFSSERYKNGLIALDLSESEDYTPKNYISKRVKSTSSSKAATAIRHNRYKLLSSSVYNQTRKHSRQPPDYNVRSFRDHGKTRKRKHEKISKSRVSRKTDRSKKKSRLDYTSSEEDPCSLDRNELRVALRHDVRATNPQGNLRNLIKDTTRTLDGAKCETIEIKDTSDKGSASDDSVSLEEQELRMIALKSAILKKHLARKRRKEIDEKKPYSPTDFLEPIGCGAASYTQSSKQFIENDPCNSMDISPIASPDMLYEDRIVKPIDMDLVDSSNSSSPIFVGQQNWTPIDEIPLPIDRKHETENRAALQFPKILSPLPIHLQTKQEIFIINSDEDDDKTVEIKSNEASSPEPIDEEANALRALLLAQKNSPRFNKEAKNIKKAEPKDLQATQNESVVESVSDRMLGILSIVKGPPHKTAVILKEAVKRLQNKTQSDTPSHDNFNSDHSDNSTQCSEVVNKLSSDIIEYRLRSPIKNVIPKEELALSNGNSTGADYNQVNGKCTGVKENISTCKGNRPNNIQIIPTAIIARSVRKSPLTEIVEVHNIKPITEISSKPETNVDSPKSPQKQSVPTLKALQMKTLNLISAGKLLKPNKTIATKLLNKAIHQNVSQLKRRTLSLQNSTIKKPKITTNSRLITKVDVPTVKRLIINVGGKSESESESDDPSIAMINSKVQIDDELYDMASPMSLPMESPCDSPLTIVSAPLSPANAVAANDVNVNVDTSVLPPPNKVAAPKKLNDSFQSKLEEFLKNARSKVDLIKKESSTMITTTPIPHLTNATPLAVRHLPPSSQLEYRRLVNRMQTLEKQKQARNKVVVTTKEKLLKVTIKNDISVARPPMSQLSDLQNDTPTNTKGGSTITYIPTTIKPVILAADIGVKPGQKGSAKTYDGPEAISKSLTVMKQVNQNFIPKPIVGKTIPTKSEKAQKTLLDIRKQHKEPNKQRKKIIVSAIAKKSKPKNLSECKEDYKQTSSSLLVNITKTINLVVSAKEEKREKLLLQNEFDQLKERMLDIETKMKLKNMKMAQIYPEISSSHKTIIELKSRTSQLEKYSVHFCKNAKTDKNKLYADEKTKIMELSKKLSAEIKNLKNLKLTDFKNRMIEIGTLAVPEMSDQGVQVDLIIPRINDNDEVESIKCETDESLVCKCDTQNVQSRLEVDSMQCVQQSNDKLEKVVYEDCIDGEVNYDRAESDENDNMKSIGGTELQNVSTIRNYISPLNFNNDKGHINPHGIICPYQLMGQCDDKECKFEHLSSTT